ncbi:uncharacterized protein LAJ45_00304 [Morchella importuna]|uniref:uncharacterized protein n=1 Tax=Morchella importuna TaxID=1174673 RepID=UPI001E8ECD7E|nr:uncharacterized protein LAJ45_00304 [Morchella importuna]KAH8155294.1 hypothetical protein LAJ45_00304 [Morchella importuna]
MTLRNFSTPSGSTTPEETPTQETETSTDKIENQYSGFRIRKVPIAKPDGDRRAARERYAGSTPMVFRSPELTGVDKVADLGRRSMLPGVFKAAEELVRGGYVPDTKLYAVLIEACGNFQGCLLQPLAFRLFEEMKARGLQVNSEIYHSLLKLLAKSPDYLKRSEVLSEMKQGWYEVTEGGWEDVIAGYILGGQLEMALEILDRRRREGRTLHRNIYKDVITGLCKVGEVDEALRLLRELEAEISWVTPPALAYTLLAAATNQLHLEATLFCWRMIIDKEMFNPDDGLCLSTLNVAARHGQPQLASDVFRVLWNRSFKYEEHHYAALLESYAVAGDLTAALSILPLMRQAGVPPVENTAQPITKRLCDDASIQEGLNLLKQMKKSGKDVDLAAIHALIAAHIVRRDIDAAFEVYKELPEFDLRPDINTFNLLLKIAAKEARKDFAVNLVGEMKEMRIEPDVETYEHLFYVSLAQDNYEDAFIYLEELKATWKHVRPSLYKALATKCYLAGDNNRYHIAVRELRAMGIRPAGFIRKLREAHSKPSN